MKLAARVNQLFLLFSKMVSRGVPQLKNLRISFCDFGGSSNGVRKALKSAEMA